MKYKITLADGTVLDNLDLNGNNFISMTKVTAEQLTDENLEGVKIDNGETEEEHAHMALVQVQKIGTKYWFILRDKSIDELEKDALVKELVAANSAVAELSELVAGFMG